MLNKSRTRIVAAAIGFLVSSWAISVCVSQDKAFNALAGEWLYVQDITPEKPIEQHGPPMSVRFTLRVEQDGVFWERPKGDERMPLDGSSYDRDNQNGSITRFSGEWKNGIQNYTLETIRGSDQQVVLKIVRLFEVTPKGLKISRILNDGNPSIALYRHPEEIDMPTPAKAKITDLAWLQGVWSGMSGTRSTEERWTPPQGGAMLGVSRTIRGEKMVAFEYLRIVEREGGLVYVAQPGGKTATEFVLTESTKNKAVFKNPRHDYPQRIVYELDKDGKLTANIGFAIGGQGRTFEFQRPAK